MAERRTDLIAATFGLVFLIVAAAGLAWDADRLDADAGQITGLAVLAVGLVIITTTLASAWRRRRPVPDEGPDDDLPTGGNDQVP